MTRDTGDVFPCGHYLGLMDEMKLWRAALSEVTVRTHLDRGIVPWHVNLPDDGLIAYVTFDAGHGVNISANKGLARDLAADFKLYPAAKEMGMWDSSDHHSVNASPLAAPPPPASPPPRPPPQEGPSVVYFNGVDTTLIASSPDGAMQPGRRLTFQAWIHPLELNRGQVLAMMGSNGWALMLTCNEGSGSACCGDYATHAPGTLMFWTMQNDPKVPRSHCASAPTSTRRVVQNKWQHVAVVADASARRVSFFIDGEPAGTTEDVVSDVGVINDGRASLSFNQKLQVDDFARRIGDDRFGSDVAVDGDTMAIAADQGEFHDENGYEVESGNTGVVYVYAREVPGVLASRWTRVAKLHAHVGGTYGASQNSDFGRAIALRGDVLVVGAKGYDNNGYSHGMVYVFERDDPGNATSGWTQVGCASGDVAACDAGVLRSQANSGTPNEFGIDVDVDGDVIVVGEYSVDQSYVPGVGSVDVFERTAAGAAWAYRETIPAPLNEENPGDYTNFGAAVAVSGENIVVGASKQDARNDDGGTVSDVGAVYVFARRDSTWSRTASLFSPDLPENYMNFGWSVDIDGDTVVVGARREHGGSGAAYVYSRIVQGSSQSHFALAAKLEDREYGGWMGGFGAGVAVRGDNIVVGADGHGGSDPPHAYLFKRSVPGDPSSGWTMVKKESPPDHDSGFGARVAVDDGAVVVGADMSRENPHSFVNMHETAYNWNGAAYVYALSGGLYLGRSGACRCLQYNGYMDEVSIWNASVSAHDIRLHYDTAPVPWHRDFDDLVAYWKFDEARLDAGDVLPSEFNRDPRIDFVTSADPGDVLWDATRNVDVARAPAPPPPMAPPPSPPPQMGPSALSFNGQDTEVVVEFGADGSAAEPAADAAIAAADAAVAAAVAASDTTGLAVFLCERRRSTWRRHFQHRRRPERPGHAERFGNDRGGVLERTRVLRRERHSQRHGNDHERNVVPRALQSAGCHHLRKILVL